MTPLTHPEARARLHHGRRWLDNKSAAALEAHLAECPECRAYAADLDALAPALAQALHARWDAVQPPRPRLSQAEDTARPARRLSRAFTLVPLVLVLLLAVVLLPLLVAPPSADLPLVVAETEVLAGLPSPTPLALLERVLFAVDVGTFSGDAPTTTVQSPPRIIAWDPVADRRLWETEVGLEPTLAVDPAGSFLYVASRPNAGLTTLAGHTLDFSALAAHSPDWPLRISVLDPASGAVLQSFDLPATLDHVEPLGVVRGRLYLFRFGLSTLDTLELFSGYYSTGVAACGGGAHANRVQFAPDGSAIYALCWPIQVGTGAPFVRITPLPSGQPRTVALAPLSSPNGLLVSPDSRRVYVTDTRLGLIGEIDTAAGRMVRTSQYKGTEREGRSEAVLALTPDGRRLYIATLGGPEVDQIRAVDVSSLELAEVLDPRPAVAHALAVRLDTLYVATDRGLGSAAIPGSRSLTLSQALPASVAQLVPYPSAVPPAFPDLPAPDLEGLNLIAFESNRDGNSEIYLTNTGTGPRNLTQRPGPDRAPAWSPDGRYLAYLADRGDRTDVMVLNVENALSSTDRIPPVRVHEGQPNLALSDRLEWSPDGTQLAVTTWPVNSAGPVGDGSVTLLDVAAALNGLDSPPPLLAIPRASGPRFSPDGTRLLYEGWDGIGGPWLFVHDLASGQRLNLTAEANSGLHWSHGGHAWSPDGKFIAYLRLRVDASGQAGTSGGELVIAAADGSAHAVVASLAPANQGPYGLAYSSDGQTLLFVANQGNTGCWYLHVFSLASQALSRLEGVCYYPLSAFPSWSPDGRFLLFTAGWVAGQPSLGTGGNLELTALDVAQALASPAQVQPIHLTHWVGDDLSPVWQP